MRVVQDYLFATTGRRLQVVVADKWNASRLLAAVDVDSTTYDVTVITDVEKPSHGQCVGPCGVKGQPPVISD